MRAHPGQRLLREVLGQLAGAEVEAQRTDQARPLGSAELDERPLILHGRKTPDAGVRFHAACGHATMLSFVVVVAPRRRRSPMTVEQILADYARDELYARLTGIWF